MTPDPITAALQQLADHHEQLTQLTELITGIGDTLREHAAALAKLAETPPVDADPDRYHPSPSSAWWKLAAADRQEPIARLQAWVEQVYRPGYGHLAATLAPCWSSHDLCLYGLDILAALAGHLVPAGSMFAFLAAHRAEVFPDAGYADLFAPPGVGRPSLPATRMAAIMTLQALHDYSDRETAVLRAGWSTSSAITGASRSCPRRCSSRSGRSSAGTSRW